MDRPERGRIASLLASPRNRILLGVAIVLSILRIALPAIVRPILVARADDALMGRIELRDLDLSLLRGGVTLHGFSVHSDERPSQAQALFQADRLHTNISWLALLSRTLRIEVLEIESFVVHLERFPEGLLLPKPVAADEPEGAEPSPPTWSLAADLISLRDGRIELLDHTLKSEPERFELGIEDFSARELAIRNDPEDEEPGRIAIEAKLDQGSVSLAAWIKQYEAGIDVRSTLTLVDVPIGKLRAYLTMFGWEALAGNLDASLEHHYEPGGVHDVRGKASLSGLSIDVPDFEEPALAWENLEIALDRVDLAKRHVEIDSIRLTGANVLVDPRSETPLVLLAPPGDSTGESQPAQAEAPPAENADENGDAESNWSWRVHEGKVADLVLDLRGAEAPLRLRAQAEIASLSSDPGIRAPVSLSIAAEQGRLALTGELAPVPFAFDGKLSIADLALTPILAQVEGPALHWVRAGSLRTELSLSLSLGGDLHASGLVGLAGLDLAEAATVKQFGVGWKDLEIAVQAIDFLGSSDREGHRESPSLDVKLARLRLDEPRFVLTRNKGGLVLPPLAAGDPVAGRERETTRASAAAEPPVESTPIAIRLSIADARVLGAKGRLEDRAVEPFYRGRIDALELQASGVRWPSNEVDALDLKLTGLRGAKLALKGSIRPGRSKLETELIELPLDQFNPYLASTGYSLRKGGLSLESKARVAPEQFETNSKVVLSALDVGGGEGEAQFQDNFGIPLSVAISLLEDLDGRIKLAIPVAGKRDEVKLGLGRIAGQALRKALVGALASPLKLLGAATRDGKVESLAPRPVPFAAGSSDVSVEGLERAEELAGLLAASPSLTLALTGLGSEPDERVLRERALLAELEANRGVRALSALGEIATRRAVRDHLASKLSGASPQPLSNEEARWLESQITRSARPTEELEGLADARAGRLRELLMSEHGISDARLVLGSSRVDPPAAEPGVGIAVGALERSTAQEP